MRWHRQPFADPLEGLGRARVSFPRHMTIKQHEVSDLTIRTYRLNKLTPLWGRLKVWPGKPSGFARGFREDGPTMRKLLTLPRGAPSTAGACAWFWVEEGDILYRVVRAGETSRPRSGLEGRVPLSRSQGRGPTAACLIAGSSRFPGQWPWL